MVKKLALFALFLLFSAGTNLQLLSQETLPDTVWTKNLWQYGDVVKAQFTHDDSKIVVLTTSKIILFDTQTGKLLKEVDYQKYSFGSQGTDLALSPISDEIAIACINGRITFMNSLTLDTLKTFYPEQSVRKISYNSSGTKLFIISSDNLTFNQDRNILIYDLQLAKITNIIGDDGGTLEICFSNSNLFATYSFKRITGTDEHKIKLWDENTLKEIVTIGSHKDDVNALDFSQDGKYLASGGEDTIVKIWDIQKQILFSEFKNNCEYGSDKWAVAIGCFKFSANAEQIVVGDKNALLSATYIWNKETGDLIYKYNYPSSRDIDVSNDFRFILSCSPKNISLLNAKWTGTDVPNEPVVETVIYPNPNDGNANIEIILDKSQLIKLEILDISGNTIQSLFSGMLNQGINNLIWETKNIPSGTYFCKITGSSFNKFIKIIVNK